MTAAVWQGTMDDIHAQSLHKIPKWRLMVSGWIALGRALEVEKYHTSSPGEQETESTFTPLERCGWKYCLCSVHKPTHCLKVCRGCWQVTYCNLQCQKSELFMASLRVQLSYLG